MSEIPVSNPEGMLTPHFVSTIIRRVTSRTGSPVHDEDLTQDVLLRALKAVRRSAPVDHPRAFFEKIVRDSVCDYFRRQRVEVAWLEAYEGCSYPTVEEQLDRDRRLSRLRSVMPALPEPGRSILHLYYFEEMPIRAIAETRQRSQSAVKMTLVRSRRHLRRLYEYGESS